MKTEKLSKKLNYKMIGPYQIKILVGVKWIMVYISCTSGQDRIDE